MYQNIRYTNTVPEVFSKKFVERNNYRPLCRLDTACIGEESPDNTGRRAT